MELNSLRIRFSLPFNCEVKVAAVLYLVFCHAMRTLGNETKRIAKRYCFSIYFIVFHILPSFPSSISLHSIVLYWRAYMRCCIFIIFFFLCEGLGLGSFKIRLTQFRESKHCCVYDTKLWMELEWNVKRSIFWIWYLLCTSIANILCISCCLNRV